MHWQNILGHTNRFWGVWALFELFFPSNNETETGEMNQVCKTLQRLDILYQDYDGVKQICPGITISLNISKCA